MSPSSTPMLTSSSLMIASSTPRSTTNSSSITIESTSSTDLMCNDPNGEWPITKAGQNVTVTRSRMCYNGTVDG